METKTTFPANIKQLRPMLQWIREAISPLKFSREDLWKIELSSEEALVNIIRHGYREKKGEIVISVKTVPQEYAKISLKDNGPSFNPLKNEKELDSCAPLEERNEGGLGIIMIRKYMDEVRYQREDSWNHLVLIKKVS